jgi:hypothetical protein
VSPTTIYHITHIDNLPSIVMEGGLLCDAERRASRATEVAIAYENIKLRRRQIPVPVAAGGVLADYVPFYFTNRSPMLYAIVSGAVSTFQGGQEAIIYLVSTVERVQHEQCLWCFTDGHAAESHSVYFTQIENLGQLDWRTIEGWKWQNTTTDLDRKRRKQAEFLVHRFFRWEWILEIGTANALVARQVNTLLTDVNHRPRIATHRNWYYNQRHD